MINFLRNIFQPQPKPERFLMFEYLDFDQVDRLYKTYTLIKNTSNPNERLAKMFNVETQLIDGYINLLPKE